jgi:hypothetical protein
MTDELSKAEAAEQAVRAGQLVTMMALFFSEQEPGVIGSVLADLMARFLSNHKITNDPAREADLRQKLLAQWCDTMWKIVEVYDSKTARMQ